MGLSSAERTRRSRAGKIERGECLHCKDKALEGRQHCATHINSQKKRRSDLIRKGQCLECPAKSVKGKRRCKKHLRKDSKRHAGRSSDLYHRRKEAGLCVQCGNNPSGRFLRCQQCRLDLSATSSRKKSLEHFEIPKSRSDAHLPSRDENEYIV